MKRLFGLSIIVCFFVITLSAKSFALDSSIGNLGLSAATKATPNSWIIIYAAQWYEGVLQNDKGDPRKLANGDRLTQRVMSNNFRTIIWTDFEILGGIFGFDLSVPLVSIANSDGLTMSGVADVSFAPINISWGTKYLDAMFAFTVILPVGDEDISSKHFSYSLAPSFTAYADEARTFEFNFAPLVEFHDQNRYGNNFTDGIDILLRYGVGYRYKTFKVGVVGYSVLQVSSDSKVNPNYMFNNQDEVHSLGGEVSYFFPSVGFGMKLLVHRDLYAQSRALGTRVHLAITKVF